MRALLLFLSRRKSLRRWMETSAPARRLAARFVAGDTLADALEAGRRINREGISLTLDHLGENVTSVEQASADGDGSARNNRHRLVLSARSACRGPGGRED